MALQWLACVLVVAQINFVSSFVSELTSWTIDNTSPLPVYPFCGYAVYDEENALIWVISGSSFATYDILTREIFDISPYVGFVYASSNCCPSGATIKDDTIYMATRDGSSIDQFYIPNLLFTPSITPFNLSRPGQSPCITSTKSNNKLYIAAFYNNNTFYIFDIDTNLFVPGPRLNMRRIFATCQILNDQYLYVMGGSPYEGNSNYKYQDIKPGNLGLESYIEYIDIKQLDVANDTVWIVIPNITLPVAPESLLSAAINEYSLIYMFGGYEYVGGGTHYTYTNVYVLNATNINNHTLTESATSLLEGRAFTPALYVGHPEYRIYIIGGRVRYPHRITTRFVMYSNSLERMINETERCYDDNSTDIPICDVLSEWQCTLPLYVTACPAMCGYCSGNGTYCANDESFTFSPQSGPALGGNKVFVNSPCFNNTPQYLMFCNFGHNLIRGIPYNSTTFVC
eukprot:762234_1